ncbi:MAG TPA: glycoside hydrolase family 47 protein [Saprospiraceae bacterium]|nr:glycoside hydrolase family 47 protein [Saprospiraceae bacterium]
MFKTVKYYIGLFIVLLGLFTSCNSTFKGARTTALGNEVIDKGQVFETIKSDLSDAWKFYITNASGFDELMPLSNSGRNIGFSSLLLTPLSAYQTLKIAGLNSEAEQCAKLILDQLNLDVDMTLEHETLVKNVLGGLLSIYEVNKEPAFLQLAKKLADKMVPIFNTPTGMPWRYINLMSGQVSGDEVTTDQGGGFLLEYYKLSQLTGEPTYYQRALKAVKSLIAKQSKIALLGSTINVRNGIWSNPEATIGYTSGDFERSLLTASKVVGDADLKAFANIHLAAIMKYLRETTNSGTWYEVSQMNLGTQVNSIFPLNAAYFPGVMRLTGQQKEYNQLFESVLRVWFEYGIGPEMLDYKTMQLAGSSYRLQGEPLESALLLYKLTGDERMMRAGYKIITSIQKFCRANGAFAALKDVRNLEKMDECDFYFFSQTLKFPLLLFHPDGTSFDPATQYITNGGFIFAK